MPEVVWGEMMTRNEAIAMIEFFYDSNDINFNNLCMEAKIGANEVLQYQDIDFLNIVQRLKEFVVHADLKEISFNIRNLDNKNYYMTINPVYESFFSKGEIGDNRYKRNDFSFGVKSGV